MNDEPPVVLGEQVVVEKGKTAIIQNQSLIISDTDSGAENLVIIVEQLPLHGELFVSLLGKVTTVLLYDNDLILYIFMLFGESL